MALFKSLTSFPLECCRVMQRFMLLLLLPLSLEKWRNEINSSSHLQTSFRRARMQMWWFSCRPVLFKVKHESQIESLKSCGSRLKERRRKEIDENLHPVHVNFFYRFLIHSPRHRIKREESRKLRVIIIISLVFVVMGYKSGLDYDVPQNIFNPSLKPLLRILENHPISLKLLREKW